MAVTWSERALSDVARIRAARKWPYITAQSQSRAARAIVEAGMTLDGEALRHPRLDDGTREKRVGKLPYLLVYEVPDESRPASVVILSVWHTAQERFASGRR